MPEKTMSTCFSEIPVVDVSPLYSGDKAGKLKLVRINKRNHFAVTEVKGMIHVPETPKIKNYHDDIQTMLNKWQG